MSSNNYKILCVDDETDLNDILQDAFELEGFSVVSAANGKEALVAIETQKFDVIVSDQCMPGMDGNELLKELHSKVTDMPLFYLCTGNSSLIKEDLSSYGLTSIIEKPYDVFDLADVISNKLKKA